MPQLPEIRTRTTAVQSTTKMSKMWKSSSHTTRNISCQQMPQTIASPQSTNDHIPNITQAIQSIPSFATQFNQMAIQLSNAFTPLI